MAHDRKCYRNSNLNPASLEEPHAIMVARELLLDKHGKYLGDDQAIFINNINTDNDTRAPNAFIREQNTIIVSAADNFTEHSPDKGHVMKCNNNAFFKLREQDRTFSGTNMLSNQRIKSLNPDIKEVVDDYEDNG